MSIINNPPLDGVISPSLKSWLSQAFAILFSVQQSGVTASRPTSNLWIGRRYYDTTLGKPVYVYSVKPTVWKDAAGTTV